ncbi:uncharacterized protein LOC124360737 isoform X3 [Homalodisca vitripennis]|uniref:uncharacterized protein LOC124360737 isoform X3 n=1 Tax=Homalodisca vitripennis TaxID=197043 RepID=UPI001EE9E9D9|nr:uncharacterized protein LOC124360737 isoform X3 [Homalodisca vitripennis]
MKYVQNIPERQLLEWIFLCSTIRSEDLVVAFFRHCPLSEKREKGRKFRMVVRNRVLRCLQSRSLRNYKRKTDRKTITEGMLQIARQKLEAGISIRQIAREFGVSDTGLRKRLKQMAVNNNSETAFKEEEYSNDEKLPEVVDMLQPMRIKEEALELEDFVDVDNSYQEASELQDQDIERNICKPVLELKEPKLPFQEKTNEKSNEIIRLMGVVSKLERVSDQIATATFGDSYDQFGKYIATLLRGLPQRTVISLKQQMVQAVLNVKLAEEQNESISETPKKSEKFAVVTPLLKISDKTNFASVKTFADNSQHLSNLQHQMISENTDISCTFTERPSTSILPTGGTSSTPSSNLTGDVSNLSNITDIDTNSQKFTIPQGTPNSTATLLLDHIPEREPQSTSRQPFTQHQKTELSDHCRVPKQPKLLSNKKSCKYRAEQQIKENQKQFLLSKESELLVSASSTEVPTILQRKRKENTKTYSKKAKMYNTNVNSDVDFLMDIEENEESTNMKQNQDSSFETVFCDPLPELKQEPPDNEEDHYMSGDSSHHS